MPIPTLDAAQEHAIHSVVAINETGKLPTPEAYATISILVDRAGFTGGLHQGSDASGTVDLMVEAYLRNGGTYAKELAAYLPRLRANESVSIDPAKPPTWAVDFMALWRRAAIEDHRFRGAQDRVFAREYRQPAETRAADMSLPSALSRCILYDTAIQSGPGRIDSLRRVFPELPPNRGGDERAWTEAFLSARRSWLASYECTTPTLTPEQRAAKTKLVRSTAYRCDWLAGLIKANAWDLRLPLKYAKRTIPVPG